jgi:serine/threonine protein kinase
MDAELEGWVLENIDHAGSELGQGYQASVTLLTSPIGDLVVKRPHGGFIFLGPRSIRREAAIYAELAGVPGIPKCHGLAANRYLVLEHVPGPSLRDRAPVDRDAFFRRLLETIQAMHAAGVAHGDLKRKDNILLGPGERPYIIDFGIARRRGPGSGRRWLFDWFRQLDLNAWIKLKHGRRPASLPSDDAKLYRPLLLERLARMIRIPWQFVTLRRMRQRWRREREAEKR